jgi:pSer/pThr/pTyr-binding forkhead associated (FHA) protein
MQYCTNCGSQNAEESKFCSQCGTKLTERPQSAASDHTATINVSASRGDTDERVMLNESDAAAVDELPEGSALLVVVRGPGAGSRFLLDSDVVTAGRHPDSDIFLDDITVSRRQVEFRRTDQGYEVVDAGSLNGTYVNRDRIDQALLQNGDEVRIGKFRMSYFVGASGNR